MAGCAQGLRELRPAISLLGAMGWHHHSLSKPSTQSECILRAHLLHDSVGIHAVPFRDSSIAYR